MFLCDQKVQRLSYRQKGLRNLEFDNEQKKEKKEERAVEGKELEK